MQQHHHSMRIEIIAHHRRCPRRPIRTSSPNYVARFRAGANITNANDVIIFIFIFRGAASLPRCSFAHSAAELHKRN